MFLSEELKIPWLLYGRFPVEIVTSPPIPAAMYFVSSMLTFFQSLTPESAFFFFFLNSGEAQEPGFSTNKKQMEDMRRSLSWESPIGFCLFTLFRIDILYCCSAAMLYCDCCLRGHIPNFWPRNEWEQFLIISN